MSSNENKYQKVDGSAPAPEGAEQDEKMKKLESRKLERKKSTLFDQLSSSNPVDSCWWFFFKHPLTRIVTAIFVMFTNLYIWLGDPGSYSNARSYGTFIGDIYHGFLQPDEPAWLAARIFLMIVLMIVGIFLGLYIQQKILRDYFHLVLFGYDNHRDPNRDPLAYQDGAFFTVICTVCVSWFVGLKLYATILSFIPGMRVKHLPDSGMYGWTFAGYNLVLAGYMTFISDWWMLGAVVDQMLQEIARKDGHGYEAYAMDVLPHDNIKPREEDGSFDEEPVPPPKFSKWTGICGCLLRIVCCCNCYSKSFLRRTAKWWIPRRIVLTRTWLAIGWPTVCFAMHQYYMTIKAVLDPEVPSAHTTLGKQWLWPAEWNNEYMRMLAGALVATCNLAIVAQDWDFPNFDAADDVKIMGLSMSFFYVNMPGWMHRCLDPSFTKMAEKKPSVAPARLDPKFYVSGKWFSYFGILFGLVFDWAYWFSTALCFRPCDYAHFWDSETGYMYAVTDNHLQEHYAGAATAKHCAWFTDNALLQLYNNRTTDVIKNSYLQAALDGEGDKERLHDSRPFVVKLEMGVFTGAYTIDESNNYVFTGEPAVKMWLMCIPPLIAWVCIGWMIFTYEKVTCFNYKRVLEWAERQEENLGLIEKRVEEGHESDEDYNEEVEAYDENEDDDIYSIETKRRRQSVDAFLRKQQDKHLAKALKYRKQPSKTDDNNTADGNGTI